MSEYRKVYPSDPGYITFDGGLNNKFEKALLQDNESPDCANVIFENGSVGTRPGWSKLNTAAIGTFVGDGLYTRRVNDGITETMCAFAGGTMWVLSGTTFVTVASAQSVWTANVRMGAAQNENYIFVCNGNVIPYKYNGAFTRHGVYPPTTTMSVASNAAGGLTGDYRYKLTNINSASVESDVGPVTATFTAAGAQLRVTSIPTFAASFGVNTRRLYRTAAGGSDFKLVTTIADNTTTQYDDSTADGSLGASAPTDQGVPPKYTSIVYHQGRLFMNDTANPNYVWYTEAFNPYVVKTTSFQRVGDNSTDVVNGVSVYQDSILVSCDKSTFLYYFPSSTTSEWKMVHVQTPYGSKSPHGVFNYNDKTMILAMQNDKIVGLGGIQGASAAPDATLLTVQAIGSDLKSQRIETDVFLWQSGYVKNFSSMVFKNKAYIAVTYGANNTTNNRIYVFDFSISNLSKKQEASLVPWTGLNPAQFTIYAGDLYYISSTATGFVYKLTSSTYSDDGTAIDSYFWTKEFSGFRPDINFHKDFRFVNLLVDNAGDYFMTILYRTDSDVGSGNPVTVDLDPGSSLWGTMVWGVDTWGGGSNQSEIRLKLENARGKRLQLKFTNQNTVNQRFRVHRANIIYNKKGLR